MRNEWDERLSRTMAADLNMVVICLLVGKCDVSVAILLAIVQNVPPGGK